MAFKHKEKPTKTPHVWIATPAYDGKCQTDFAMALAETCQLATAMGVRVTVCMMKNSIFIDIARNQFVRLFLETDATHLFFIDSDLQFEPRAVLSLVKANHPVSAGVYPRRQMPLDYPASFAPHPTGGGLWVEDGWVMCKRVPTGFLCISRKVVEEMVKDAIVIRSKNDPDCPRLFYTYMNEEGYYIGEDFAFCDDYVKKYGRFIPVWPDFDFVHGVDFKGNLHEYLNEQTEKELIETAA